MRLLALICATAVACGPEAGPAVPPPQAPSIPRSAPAQDATPAPAPAPRSAASPAPAPPPDPAVAISEKLAADIIANDVMAYSPSEKAFSFRIAYLQEGMGPGLSVDFMGEDGKEREAVRICDPGDCNDHEAERVKEFIPKLGAHFRLGAYVPIQPIGWPEKKKDLEIDVLGRLHFEKNRLELTRKGKSKSSFPALPVDAAYEIEPKAIGLTPGSHHFVFKAVRSKKAGQPGEYHFLEAGVVYDAP